MYFTSFAKYTIPYCYAQEAPAVLVCLVSPGNPYPAVEHPLKASSLRGQAILSGFQSHYVVVNKGGLPVEKMHFENEFDEWVINQESQVVPLYLVKLKNEGLMDLWKAEPSKFNVGPLGYDPTRVVHAYERKVTLEDSESSNDFDDLVRFRLPGRHPIYS